LVLHLVSYTNAAQFKLLTTKSMWLLSFSHLSRLLDKICYEDICSSQLVKLYKISCVLQV
jgi:hypothetical protein